MWQRIRKFFHDSEVIFLARFQVFLGVLIEAISEADPKILSGFVPDKWFGVYLLIAGIIIELARRSRDPERFKKKGQ